ncbi:MAG: hypothetical protein JWQ02_690 [Capsulimonas sp.]|nr:hypothetical protein [Capsulimonas sp.]
MKGLLKITATALLAATTLGHAAPQALAQGDPVIKVHTGKYYDFYTTQNTWDAMKPEITPNFKIYNDAVDKLIHDWGIPAPKKHYYCYVDPSGKNGAYATGDIGQVSAARRSSPSTGIGVNSNLFQVPGYGVPGGTATVFGVHEIVNDFTGAVSGGWPRDWWADDRSPFPGMTEIHLLNELGLPEIAKADDKDLSRDPLYVMFKAIQAKYGWGVFSRMFSNMTTNHVNWSQVDSGHNPSAVLTNMVTAYMVLGSGDTPDSMDTLFTIGPVPGYSLETTKANLAGLGYGGPPPASGEYTLTSVKSGQVLDAGANMAGLSVKANTPDEASDEQWTLTPLGKNRYSIKSVRTGLALEAGSKTTSASVRLSAPHKTLAQTWTITSSLNGFVIASSLSKRALDGGAGKSSANLLLKPASGGAAQKWIIH